MSYEELQVTPESVIVYRIALLKARDQMRKAASPRSP